MIDPIASAIMTVSHKGIAQTVFEMSAELVPIYTDG
jgi:hypothetical protein